MDCGSLPHFELMNITYNDTGVGVYTCAAGYKYADGEESKNITCLETGDWSNVTTYCNSKLVEMLTTYMTFKNNHPFVKMLTMHVLDTAGMLYTKPSLFLILR